MRCFQFEFPSPLSPRPTLKVVGKGSRSGLFFLLNGFTRSAHRSIFACLPCFYFSIFFSDLPVSYPLYLARAHAHVEQCCPLWDERLRDVVLSSHAPLMTSWGVTKDDILGRKFLSPHEGCLSHNLEQQQRTETGRQNTGGQWQDTPGCHRRVKDSVSLFFYLSLIVFFI